MRTKFKTRCLKLANKMDQVHAETPELFDLGEIAKETDCGTVACACGYAPVVFPRVFKYKKNPSSVRNLMVRHINPNLQKFGSSVDTVRHYLGLTEEQANNLFYWRDGNQTAKDVADKLRAIVAANGKLYLV